MLEGARDEEAWVAESLADEADAAGVAVCQVERDAQDPVAEGLSTVDVTRPSSTSSLRWYWLRGYENKKKNYMKPTY